MQQPSSTMLVEDSELFFAPDGPGVLKLSPLTAVDVCLRAAARGYLIARIEGGIWHAPGFEARVDCIWDGADPPVTVKEAEANNTRAATFIQEESSVHTAFVLTAPPLTGYPHLTGVGRLLS